MKENVKHFGKRVLAIAKKNARIYYLKPPVLIFGLFFPAFMFLAFSIGRDMEPARLVPALLSMSILFTASSVGPLITPWERQNRTYERLLTVPVSVWHIVLGDVVASFVYGMLISLIPLGLGLLALGANLIQPLSFVPIMIITVACFSAMGTAIAAIPTDQLSNVMMFANLIRLPMLFISGVFVPLAETPAWGKAIAHISPLSYTVDLIRWSFGEPTTFSNSVSVIALVLFTGIFLRLAVSAHHQARAKMF